MSPPVHTTTVTSVGKIILPSPGLSWLLNAIEGTVTEIDFDSVPDGTAIDTHYASAGVTFDSINNNGVHIGSAFAGRPDPSIPNNVVTVGLPTSAFNDLEDGGVRVIFKEPQLFVSIDARPVIYTGEF